MKLRILTLPVLALAFAGCESLGMGGPSPADYSMEKIMPKWQAFMTPGPEHQVLQNKVGKWNVKSAMYGFDGSVANSTGTSEFSWLLDGRYLQETATGDMGGMPFQGRGTTAYDNMKKRYVSSWIDNFGTGIMTAEGTYDATHKTFNFAGEAPDVVRGEYVKSRMVETVVDKDHWRLEMFQPGPDGKEKKVMELNYSRS
jgi:Protein of unknown function (DUF1579)